MKKDYIFRIKNVLLSCLLEYDLGDKIGELFPYLLKEEFCEEFLDKHAHDNIIFPRGDYSYLDSIVRKELSTKIQEFVMKTLSNNEITEKEGIVNEEQE